MDRIRGTRSSTRGPNSNSASGAAGDNQAGQKHTLETDIDLDTGASNQTSQRTDIESNADTGRRVRPRLAQSHLSDANRGSQSNVRPPSPPLPSRSSRRLQASRNRDDAGDRATQGRDITSTSDIEMQEISAHELVPETGPPQASVALPASVDESQIFLNDDHTALASDVIEVATPTVAENARRRANLTLSKDSVEPIMADAPTRAYPWTRRNNAEPSGGTVVLNLTNQVALEQRHQAALQRAFGSKTFINISHFSAKSIWQMAEAEERDQRLAPNLRSSQVFLSDVIEALRMIPAPNLQWTLSGVSILSEKPEARNENFTAYSALLLKCVAELLDAKKDTSELYAFTVITQFLQDKDLCFMTAFQNGHLLPVKTLGIAQFKGAFFRRIPQFLNSYSALSPEAMRPVLMGIVNVLRYTAQLDVNKVPTGLNDSAATAALLQENLQDFGFKSGGTEGGVVWGGQNSAPTMAEFVGVVTRVDDIDQLARVVSCIIAAKILNIEALSRKTWGDLVTQASGASEFGAKLATLLATSIKVIAFPSGVASAGFDTLSVGLENIVPLLDKWFPAVDADKLNTIFRSHINRLIALSSGAETINKLSRFSVVASSTLDSLFRDRESSQSIFATIQTALTSRNDDDVFLQMASNFEAVAAPANESSVAATRYAAWSVNLKLELQKISEITPEFLTSPRARSLRAGISEPAYAYDDLSRAQAMDWAPYGDTPMTLICLKDRPEPEDGKIFYAGTYQICFDNAGKLRPNVLPLYLHQDNSFSRLSFSDVVPSRSYIRARDIVQQFDKGNLIEHIAHFLAPNGKENQQSFLKTLIGTQILIGKV